MSSLLVSQSDGVAHISLNRPDVRNAFDDMLITELTEAFRTVDARAVVLAGEGKVFCAGGDLNWMRRSIGYTEQQNLDDARKLAEMFRAIDECPCAVIGRVQGAAYGGGVGLASVCDIVVADTEARFCFSEVKLGLAPAVISSFALRKIGVSAARRYFLSAEIIDAETARGIGLAHEVVPLGQMDAAVSKLVESLMRAGPQAVREAKSLMRTLLDVSPKDALEVSAEAIARLRVSPEGQEGVSAFLEKRKPSWT
ncbi:MAG: enoyl-CoA hydratase/isomerase family protein [Armatimonadetes bacterium]|nr:enoyl-CoA hydratase/isomerase family protein [Armatimonadota bacterium]